MKRIALFLLVLLLSVWTPADIFANSWPRMNGANKQNQCKQALSIAKAMFKSDAYVLYAPPAISAKFPATLVLSPEAIDISGGNALKADKTAFVKLPISDEGVPRSIYWQRVARHGYRLVIRETSVGWRGDMYSIYAIGEELKPEEFLAATGRNQNDPKFTPVISNMWRPPLVFLEKQSGDCWFIYVGEPYQFLADWQVYNSGPTGVKSVCSIQFRPAVDNAKDLLPPPVRELAVLLDETMGQGKDEGTLRPTARLKIDVQTTWANVILRPWALREPYNTREEVNDGLKNWSCKGPSYLRHYQYIQQQYPKAERSLAEYYQTNFGLSPEKARIQSAYALDIAFRSHFAFNSNDPNSYFRFDEVNRNPWGKK